MANETLVAAVKGILTLAKTGRSDEAYAGYAQLFGDPAFTGYRPEDQRQALKLMVLAKGLPVNPPPPMVTAFKRALGPLQALVAAHQEPVDYEMVGVCHIVLGDEPAARKSFQAGLDLERQRDPQSDLCGTLMKRVASV